MNQLNNPPNLTKQEQEVLQEIATAQPNRKIADKLCLSPHTIKNHKANIMKKLGISSTLGLFEYALHWAKQKATTLTNNSESKDNLNEDREGGGGVTI